MAISGSDRQRKHSNSNAEIVQTRDAIQPPRPLPALVSFTPPLQSAPQILPITMGGAFFGPRLCAHFRVPVCTSRSSGYVLPSRFAPLCFLCVLRVSALSLN